MARPRKSRPIAANQKKLKFHLECGAPIKDNLIELVNMEKYFKDKMKIGPLNKTADGKLLEITSNPKHNRITFVARAPLRKRAIKYYTKKYLQKQQLRDYIRVLAKDKNSFECRYYKLEQN